MNNITWLPELEYFNRDDSVNFQDDWKRYEDYLYSIFRKHFIMNKIFWDNLPLRIRYHPKTYGKEEAFYHITCKEYDKDGERAPDFRRCERIRWPKAILEKAAPPNNPSDWGILMWVEKKNRIHLFIEIERYLVVIEKRLDYCLLITAFFVEHDHYVSKLIKRYNRYKK